MLLLSSFSFFFFSCIFVIIILGKVIIIRIIFIYFPLLGLRGPYLGIFKGHPKFVLPVLGQDRKELEEGNYQGALRTEPESLNPKP